MEDMFDKDITILNKYIDTASKTEKYKMSRIKGFWSSNKGLSISDTQLIKQDGGSVRILMNDTRNEEYQKPSDFAKNQETWTLQKDDYIIKGIVDSFEDISSLLKNNEEVLKITNIEIKDYGSDDMKHWVVEGK